MMHSTFFLRWRLFCRFYGIQNGPEGQYPKSEIAKSENPKIKNLLFVVSQQCFITKFIIQILKNANCNAYFII